MMAETKVNTADNFETVEEEMAVFLLNEAFHRGVLDEEQYFILLRVEYHKNQRNFPQWKYARFILELPDDERYLPNFGFTKQKTIRLSCFWISRLLDTIKTLNQHVVSSVEILCIVIKWLVF